MTHYIPFTQYFRPNGRQEQVAMPTERLDVVNKADIFIAAGFHFEVEELTNGAYSHTIGDEHGDYAYAIVPRHLNDTHDVFRLKCIAAIEQMILNTSVETLSIQSEEAQS